MSEIVARCGFRCDKCMAYTENSHSNDERARVAEAWSKYFNLTVSPETLCCNGCRGEKCEGSNFPDPTCPIRACVIEKGMNTCADCLDYPCEKIESRMSGVEEVIWKFEGKIPESDVESFIRPYDARNTLNEIRDRRIEERSW